MRIGIDKLNDQCKLLTHLKPTSHFSHSVSILVEMVALFFLFEPLNLPVVCFYHLGLTVQLVELVEQEDCENPALFSSLCVCVLFFQSVIVIPLAQSVIAVMAQDIVYVRRALQGPSVRSVYPAICGTMAANVSRTANRPERSSWLPPHPLYPRLCLLLLTLPGVCSPCGFQSFGWRNVQLWQTQTCPSLCASLITWTCLSCLLWLNLHLPLAG